MKVLVVGSGGREHALIWKISQSPLVTKIYCAPGNGGISELAECVSIAANDCEALATFGKEMQVDLTVVGPEIPLVNGIVDCFEAAGLCIFGPNKAAAQLEGSKVFAKTIMAKYGIPTAAFKVFDTSAEAKSYLLRTEPPFVIKADGLAAGKGVIIARTTEEGVQAVTNIMENKIFGDAGNRIIIEEYIEGEELSVLVFTDGTNVLPLASSQDHKRAYDNDEGPNTGGMGAYSPCPLVSQNDIVAIVNKTVKPAIRGLKKEGYNYEGLLYAGLMISKKGPMVLEYNVRFGDPETQAILPRLKDDIVPIILEVAQGRLKTSALSWDARTCIAVVLASGGYPGSYQKGYEITGIADAKISDNIAIFQAGTTYDEQGRLVTNGGRILSVAALGETFKVAQERVYASINCITFKDSFYRSDIGSKALQHITQ